MMGCGVLFLCCAFKIDVVVNPVDITTGFLLLFTFPQMRGFSDITGQTVSSVQLIYKHADNGDMQRKKMTMMAETQTNTTSKDFGPSLHMFKV